jgi:Zn-dependent peptidase ImmA (M78 family)
LIRPDDSSLTHEQLTTVQKRADLLLREASAYGRFPTPIDDLMQAAKLIVVDDELLDQSKLQWFLKQAKAGIATLKSALSKVLGLFEPNDRLVVIDRDTPKPKIPFVKLHEAGHGSLPHQCGMYRLIHDCDKTLDPDITDLFEREANVFASETLFQGDTFAHVAHDSAFSIKIPMALAKDYGASQYATFRRYITTNPNVCCLVVLDSKTLTQKPDGSFSIDVRRIVPTESFNAMYDAGELFAGVDHKHPLGPIVPIGRKMTAPRQIILRDRNGDEHICRAEAFDTTKQILILILDEKRSNKSGRIVVPATFAVSGRQTRRRTRARIRQT